MLTPFLGTAYYPEDWDEFDMYYDIAKMKEAGIKVARIGEFAWKKMEPEEGRYEFKWLHKVVDTLGENGIKTVMGTPTATPPVWFLKKHPEAARLEANNIRVSHGGRRHCCSSSPAYLEYSYKIVEKMGIEFADDKNIIGWQIDNEIFSWNHCCCEYCVNGFRKYLENKYIAIDELNRRWNLNIFSQAYSSFDEIPPAENTWHNPHIKYEWTVFHQNEHIRFIHKQAEILKKYTSAPIGTDMMPTNGLDYEKTCAPLDVIMFNHYNDVKNISNEIFWFDYLRTLKNVPFWNTETSTSWNGSTSIDQIMKPEGFCRINSWLPVALGGESNMYWLFRQHWAGHELMHGALLYPSGKPFHIFSEVQQTASEFEKTADFINSTKVRTDVAIHFTSVNWNLFDAQKIINDFNYGDFVINYFHKPMSEYGIRPDVIGSGKSLEEYRLIFSPFMMTLEDNSLNEKIIEWVRDGGVWVAGPMTDIRNSTGAHYRKADTGILEEITGCELSYSIPDSSEIISSEWNDGEKFTGSLWHELYTVSEKAETLVAVKSGHSAIKNKSVIFKVPFGKGEIIVLGSIPSKNDIKKIIEIAIKDAGVNVYDLTGEVAVVPRAGKEKEGLILAEYGNSTASCLLPYPMKDLLTGKRIDYKATLNPYDMLILEKA